MAREVMFPGFSRRARILAWAVTGLIWAVLCTPLIVTPTTLFPYQASKGIAIRVLIEIAATLYLWLAVIEPRARPRPDRLFWSVIVFVGVLVLTALTGLDPYRSFWGDLDRMDGVFSVLHGVAAFVIAVGFFTRRDQWLWIFRISLAASIFVTWYALAQMYPWARVVPVFELRETRPGSTLGFSSFAATYAVFQVFFAAFLIVLERTPSRKLVAFGLLLMNFVLLSLTAIRGAQVALLAAMAVGAVVFVLDRGRSIRKRLAVAAAVVVCVGGFFGVLSLKGSSILQSMPLAVERMATISTSATTAQTRLIALGASWHAWKERPLLGWGPENFDVAYNRYFDPEILTHEDSWFDRPHNKLAEIAVHSGIVGLLSYLAMFAFSAAGVVRAMRRPLGGRDRSMATLVLMLGTAYFVQNLFLFDTAGSTVLFFASLAFAGHLSNEWNERMGEKVTPPQGPVSGAANTVGRWWMIVAILGVGAMIVWCNVAPLRAAQLGGACVRSNQPRQAAAFFRQAIDQGSFAKDDVIRMALHSLIATGRVSKPDWDVLTFEVQTAAELLLSQGRANLRTLVAQGKAYNRRGVAYAPDAERVLRQTLAMAPRMHHARYELGVTMLRVGNIEAGLRSYREVVALNEHYAKGHWVLGIALMTQRQFPEGLKEVERALELGYHWDTPEDIAHLARIYEASGSRDRLRKFAELVVERHPSEAPYRLMLARACVMTGDRPSASVHALKAASLDPRFEREARAVLDRR